MTSNTTDSSFKYQQPFVCESYVQNFPLNAEARAMSSASAVNIFSEIGEFKRHPEIVDAFMSMTSRENDFQSLNRNRRFNVPTDTSSSNTSYESVRSKPRKLDYSRIAVVTECQIVPTKSIKEIFYFDETIRKYLYENQYNNINEIQSYAWPHLMRGNSLILLSDSKTSNTRVCLPAFCSIALVRVRNIVGVKMIKKRK